MVLQPETARPLALERYAHDKGHASIDDYNKAAEKLLIKEQRDKYTSIQKKLIFGGGAAGYRGEGRSTARC
ncbi:uncharacterized protein LAJ45_01212 [Morchella importuna]|uniref:uncharacterized protein n=1 Tax=Morchella importuna TaxID=1174673 RepID=UPI001E8D1FBB|nr:uncharacterized protein LAJ45_01212 [Morchella importuna]KAH8154681.1 hypothetical protein LAJ45_01212 [Morchella importuna]